MWRIWIEFSSGKCNNCMSSSCHGSPGSAAGGPHASRQIHVPHRQRKWRHRAAQQACHCFLQARGTGEKNNILQAYSFFFCFFLLSLACATEVPVCSSLQTKALLLFPPASPTLFELVLNKRLEKTG